MLPFKMALKGITGEYEINRLIGALGGLSYIVGAHVFVGINLYHGKPFDLTEYCLVFPAGLGVTIGAIAGAVSYKDNGVAKAKITSETGAIPVAPPDGPKVQPSEVKEI
jgi:hypothetical protein